MKTAEVFRFRRVAEKMEELLHKKKSKNSDVFYLKRSKNNKFFFPTVYMFFASDGVVFVPCPLSPIFSFCYFGWISERYPKFQFGLEKL